MKKRILSAIVLIIIMGPILAIGGTIFDIGVLIVGIIGLKEFMDIKENKKKIPDFIKFISYILFIFFILGFNNTELFLLTIDYRFISGLFLTLLIPSIIYHDKTKYSINDAFYMIGGVFFLGIAFKLMILFRGFGIKIFLYLLLISIVTDVFAYLTGFLIGKNKLIESISPKKTIEGMIGGTLAACIICTMFYYNIVSIEEPIYIIVLITLFLSILGQLGDLVFSSIKRYYGKKDFSNMIPGHGGILDRFDNIIFVMLGFLFFVSLL